MMTMEMIFLTILITAANNMDRKWMKEYVIF